MLNARAYRETRAEQTLVLGWCEAGLQVPGLEPERRARIVEIRQAVSDRICAAKPHDTDQLGDYTRRAREELVWLKEDARITWLRR
ncbi:MAG: hypothetical protein WAP03_23885 [Methylorubrum rhodinum]|jgi:hypothetical protein|uniref:hypothetical protein n=1 Tax=Methylorubrum rhodinum TaxID=29428 RepID=UPI0010568E15